MTGERVKEENKIHRDEMNLVEFPIGLLADRVPIDPATGNEHTEIRLERTITDNGEAKQQRWIVHGEPSHGGLPRGYDLDVFTAIMTLWSRNGFQDRLISLGSSYALLKKTGKGVSGEQYARFAKSIDRLFGLWIEAQNAIYDPAAKKRVGKFKLRLFSSVMLKNPDDAQAPRGYVRVTEEFHWLLQLGYIKLTDMERYWRLPTTYSRRLFQYLDKHRNRALNENAGRCEINGYLLAKKLGTLDQTLKSYRPAKLRDVMGPHLEALKADNYLSDFRWKKDGKGCAPVMLEVIYAAQPTASGLARVPTDDEITAVYELGRMLGEPENTAYHSRIFRELGPTRTKQILNQVIVRSELDPTTHKGKLFTFLAQQNRQNGKGRRPN